MQVIDFGVLGCWFWGFAVLGFGGLGYLGGTVFVLLAMVFAYVLGGLVGGWVGLGLVVWLTGWLIGWLVGRVA